MGSNTIDTNQRFRVLVLGGSYAGLSAALNLYDLCLNKDARCGTKREDLQDSPCPERTFVPDITIVDERDGFCKRSYAMLIMVSSRQSVFSLTVPRSSHWLPISSCLGKLRRKGMGQI
jgi:hypothetical protein